MKRRTLSTDDTTVSDLSLSDEYVRAVEQIGLTIPELWAIDRHALEVAFAEPGDLDPIRERFATWAENVAEVRSEPSMRYPA